MKARATVTVEANGKAKARATVTVEANAKAVVVYPQQEKSPSRAAIPRSLIGI